MDNPNTILDATDLVFIDPVGTSASRPAKGEKGEQFWSVDGDIESVGEFIRLFADVFRHAYLARMSLVDATKFRYLGDRIMGEKATVDTQVTTKRGSSIAT